MPKKKKKNQDELKSQFETEWQEVQVCSFPSQKGTKLTKASLRKQMHKLANVHTRGIYKQKIEHEQINLTHIVSWSLEVGPHWVNQMDFASRATISPQVLQTLLPDISPKKHSKTEKNKWWGLHWPKHLVFLN